MTLKDFDIINAIDSFGEAINAPMNVLQIESRGGVAAADSGLPSNRVCCAIVLKDGRRAFVEFSGYDKTIWRKTNKRTGAALKKAVVDHIEKNRIHMDLYIYENNEVVSDHYNSFVVFDRCHGDIELQKIADHYYYNNESVLEIISKLTGVYYSSFEVVGDCVNHEEWQKIANQERAEAIDEWTEKEAAEINRQIDKYINCEFFPAFLKNVLMKRINLLEKAGGISEDEKEKARAFVNNDPCYFAEGFRGDAIAFVKDNHDNGGHLVVKCWNLQTGEYCNIDLKNKCFC